MDNQPTPRPNMVRRRVASFGYAFQGVWSALKTEVHLQFHAASTVITIGLGLYLGLARWEWVAVAVAIGAVWSAELVNTAIETIVNLVSPEYHPLAGLAKDVAAGAVLVMAVAALAVGLLIFGPKVWALLA